MAQEIVSQFTFDPGESVQKVGSVRQEIRQLKEAMLSMTEDDPRWQQTFARYSELQNHVRELNRLSKATDPANQVKNYMRLAEGGVGAFTSLRSAAVLFGDANEETLKKIAQVEAAMGVLKGLKAFDEGLRTAREMFKVMSLTGKATKVASVETKVLGEAQVASAEATEGASMATKGLGYALKGIGIGLIIAAVMYLVDNWKELKKEFQGLLPDVSGASGAFDKFKQILTGVGSVIVNILLTPIKELIAGIKSFITVVTDLTKGDFSKAFDDIGNAVKKQVDIIKDGYDVVKHYKEGEAASAASQAEARHKEALQAEIDNLDDIIAIRKEKGQETFQLELKQLNDKKELAADEPKELKKVNLEIEKLIIDHHKKLAEEAKQAAEKAAEEARKEAARAEQIQKDHLRRQAETAAQLKEAQLKEAEELLKSTAEFLQKGQELDEDSNVKKLARLTKEYDDLKAKTIASHGDLNAIEVSYENQRRELLKDMAESEAADRAKAQEAFIAGIRRANQETLENTKLSLRLKEQELRASIQRIKDLLKQGAIDQKVADNALAESAKAQQQLDKEVAQSKKESVAGIGGALNALSGIVNKKSAEGKAIAVGQATINAYQGFAQALASAPPPFNIIEAGAVLAAGLANVKKIVSTKVGTGGGGGGSSPSIAGSGGSALAFNAPAVPQSNPTTNLSQDSINSISANNTQQSQVVVSESDITNTQSRVAGYAQAAVI